ncbi:hypothetical protein RI129_009342 [Pyrocoelia pectoralis]|uniref:Trimethyllysine dioxygenase, mitochondrial n=1 Tax=Pyrocoelia pectoralis TaxID=417401 RepID=A0AAN7V1P0_9COLE
MESFGALQIEEEYVSIHFGEHQKQRFYYIWLRDNCKCEECYSKFYNQILFNIANIPLDIKPDSLGIIKDVLSITWMDGHETTYEMKWLESISFPFKPVLDTILWDNKIITKSLKRIPVESYFNDTNGTERLIDAIRKYGFGIVSGVENTLEATEKVAKHFTSVHKTCFGEMWKVSTYSTVKDTSSSTVALLPHNDNTYWTNATGLIIFHLLYRNGEGGQTILVDGFNVAEKVRSKNPDAFNLLCNSPIESHFIDKSQHYFCTESVIKLHSVTKQLYQIRFNIYDRSPLVSLPEEVIPKYYEAYQLFAREAFDPRNRLEIQLEPGDVLFVDNWRILHGRNAFTGERELGGCYVSRDDYISQVKKLNPKVH